MQSNERDWLLAKQLPPKADTRLPEIKENFLPFCSLLKKKGMSIINDALINDFARIL